MASWPDALVVGMILLGGVNGGSSSNLLTLIAGADVPLSVLMTITTTVGATVAMPLLAKYLIGAVVPVDGWGMLKSALTIVLGPLTVGVSLNAIAPRVCRKFEPLVQVLCVSAAVVVISRVVAGSAPTILEMGFRLHATVAALHVLSAAVGYALSAMCGCGEVVRRTVTIEVAMKNASLACMLAAAHFEDPVIQAPAATSCIWCPIFGFLLAAYWKARPVRTCIIAKAAPSRNHDWVDAYIGA
eukprot:CAMPEP_0117474114 /NCGR_PEP_ID=MMETSP0784-20121206/9119_1 /TAXON_ID=39447 /ORGANISM="" /LENGTH=242 /DNA_ID=CAMNT_0005268333 /DNA_START=305 /DNA_END=1033 /DNA_ORIENTATION=+